MLCRYIVIPGNRGKSNDQLGMAMRGTGGSGKLSALDIVVNTRPACQISAEKNYSFQTKKDEISRL